MERFKFTVGYVTNSPSFWAFIGSLIFILAFVHEYSFKFLGNSLKWVPFVKINGKAFRTLKRETFLQLQFENDEFLVLQMVQSESHLQSRRD